MPEDLTPVFWFFCMAFIVIFILIASNVHHTTNFDATGFGFVTEFFGGD